MLKFHLKTQSKFARTTSKISLARLSIFLGALILFSFGFIAYERGTTEAQTKSLAVLPYFANAKKLPCKPIITAHRGTMGRLENTVPGIRNALNKGVDAVEIDVRETKDGVLVLMHDGSVNRTTNGNGRLRQMTFEEVQKLRVKGNIRVPTLRKALEVISSYPRRTVQLDIKGLHINEQKLDLILQLIERFNMRERVIVASTNTRALELFDQYASDIPTGYIQPVGVWPVLRRVPSHIDTLNVHWEEATPARIKHARSHGFGVLARTVNGERTTRTVIKRNALVIVTDTPADAVKACRAVAK